MVEMPLDGGDAFAEDRRALLAEVAREVRQTSRYLGKDTLDARVLAALAKVPRHEFVAEESRAVAYENRPLPIGQGQTISQPYIVAVMSDAARLAPDSRVLEIGTGCGYQAAVLAELAGSVDTVELLPGLAGQAAARLARLGYGRVRVHVGNGAAGWPAAAPYDAVVVTAAARRRAPPALVEQLAPGGRLVIPIERRGFAMRYLAAFADQELVVLTKGGDGAVSERVLLPVAFVPLVES